MLPRAAAWLREAGSALPALEWRAAAALNAYTSRSKATDRLQARPCISARTRAVHSAAPRLQHAHAGAAPGTVARQHAPLSQLSPAQSSHDDDRERSLRIARDNLCFYLHGLVARPPEELVGLMDEIGEHLTAAKRALEETGQTDTTLDARAVGCLVNCEDVILRHCEQSGDTAPLTRMLGRLATTIQNLPLLMVRTEARLFDECLLRLFRCYFAACRISGDADRAHSAWLGVHQAQQTNVLTCPQIAMDYVDTLITAVQSACAEQGRRRVAHKRYDISANVWRLFDAACQELISWELVSPHSQSADTPRRRRDDGHSPISTVAVVDHSITQLQRSMPLSEATKLNTLYSRAVRMAIVEQRYQARGKHTRRPETLLRRLQALRESPGGRAVQRHNVSLTTNPSILRAVLLHLSQNAAMGADEQKELISLCVNALPPTKLSHYVQRDPGTTEGLASTVLALCATRGSGLAAVQLLDMTRDSLARVRTSPLAPRDVVVNGVRRPTAACYHATIDALVASNDLSDEERLSHALTTLALLEADYTPTKKAGLKLSAPKKHLIELEPTRTLASLSRFIGETPERWNAAWALLSRWDARGTKRLTVGQLNVMIAALRFVPPTADLPASRIVAGVERPTGKQCARVMQAISLHDVISKGFEGPPTINTYNALLAAFSSGLDTDSSQQMLVNLLELMAKNGVKLSFEASIFIVESLLETKKYKNILAVIKELLAEDLPLPFQLIDNAREAALADGDRDVADELDRVLFSARAYRRRGKLATGSLRPNPGSRGSMDSRGRANGAGRMPDRGRMHGTGGVGDRGRPHGVGGTQDRGRMDDRGRMHGPARGGAQVRGTVDERGRMHERGRVSPW